MTRTAYEASESAIPPASGRMVVSTLQPAPRTEIGPGSNERSNAQDKRPTKEYDRSCSHHLRPFNHSQLPIHTIRLQTCAKMKVQHDFGFALGCAIVSRSEASDRSTVEWRQRTMRKPTGQHTRHRRGRDRGAQTPTPVDHTRPTQTTQHMRGRVQTQGPARQGAHKGPQPASKPRTRGVVTIRHRITEHLKKQSQNVTRTS